MTNSAPVAWATGDQVCARAFAGLVGEVSHSTTPVAVATSPRPTVQVETAAFVLARSRKSIPGGVQRFPAQYADESSYVLAALSPNTVPTTIEARPTPPTMAPGTRRSGRSSTGGGTTGGGNVARTGGALGA